ncbi:MAG: septum formation initiator family protein [Candidatus Paceibacterota bacterium]
MHHFKKKAEYKFWHSPIMLVVLFGVVVIFAYNLIGLLEKERETSKKKELALDQIESLKKRQTILEGDIARLETDDGIEEAIRDKYQVVKEGEKVVTIVNEEAPTNVDDENNKEHGFWNFLKRIF